MARILAISSQVVRGGVGLSASVPALQTMGHEVWALPTIHLSHRPGLGRIEKLVPSPETLASMLAALEAEGCFASVDAVLTGYFPTPEAVEVVAAALHRLKAIQPEVCILCDPVLGDGDRLYISEATARAMRDRLLPLATVATPNRFELEWLTGREIRDRMVAITAARRLGPPTVVVTSATETTETLTTLLVSGALQASHDSPRLAHVPNGTGDALSGLLLAGLAEPGFSPIDAFDRAMTLLDAMVARSTGRDTLALSPATHPSAR